MPSHLSGYGTRKTPQDRPLAGQVANSAGGHAWEVDCFTRLRRFLILGSEGGSYYASERKLTTENVDALAESIATDGPRTVELIAEVSEGGFAPKNDQAIFALAYCVAEGDEATKRAALEALPKVCRIATHLFMFVGFLDGSFGKATGRAKRRALGAWYTEKSPEQLAYQLVKYREREGWSHRDVLRLAHPKTSSEPHRALFDFACGRVPDTTYQELAEGGLSDAEARESARPSGMPRIIEGYRRAQKASTPAETAELALDYKLPREALNTDHLTSREVWLAMLESGMPTTALVRNLANMTRAGAVAPGSHGLAMVLEALADEDRIRRSRIHPLNVLMAMATYQSGHGFRGGNTWIPVVQVVDALDGAFYKSFKNVEPSGKRHLLAVDVSGSMENSQVAGTPLSAREAAAGMMLVIAAQESYEAVAFCSDTLAPSYQHQGGPLLAAWAQRRGELGYGESWRAPATSSSRGFLTEDGLTPIPLSPRQRLTDAVALVADLPFGGTDCSLPMLYAIDKGREVDVFVIYTDNETWAGQTHPAQALREYRRQSGIDARLVVVGMVSNGFSIADPNDAGMLDVVGFDSSAPALISDFAAGRV